MRRDRCLAEVGRDVHVMEEETHRLLFTGRVMEAVRGRGGRAVVSKENGKTVLIEPADENKHVYFLPA